jgi:glycosyltransferase involved in cell wall biosynthesis
MPPKVALIIPALDEEATIRGTLDGLPRGALAQIIVVDNGSRDRTAEQARTGGALVVLEPRRGYGRACLAGIAALDPGVEVVAFMDADGSDDPADLPRLVAALDQADMAIGSRLLGSAEAGSLAPMQRAGNRLATFLLSIFYGASYTDLGPFRAVRRDALVRLAMRDLNFGWTIEMQIKARRANLRVVELPVSYRRRRGGRSKVSGSLRGSVLAGAKILWTILRYRFSS